MYQKISKVFLTTLLALCFYSGSAVAADNSLGLSVGLDYQSMYLWRGTYFYQNGVFFPKASYAFGDTGLSVSVWAELADAYFFDGTDSGVKDFQATDFGIDYAKTFNKFVNVGAGFWYFLMWEPDNSFMYWYVSLGLALPLNPTVTLYHDIYQKEQANDGQYSDIYIQLALSHGFELTKEAGITAGAAAGYYRNKSLNRNGISDIDLSAELAVTKGIVTFIGSFHLIIVPSKDYYSSRILTPTPSGNDDIVRYYAKFGASLSF